MRSWLSREHDFVGPHAGLAHWHAVQRQLNAEAALARHLKAGGGKASRPHILDGNDRIGGHQLQAGLDQQLFGEGVADLNGRALLLRLVVEGGGRHRGAVDAVTPGLRTDIDDRVARALSLGREDPVGRRDADGHGVDQRVAVVGGVELALAADGRHADAIAIAADAAHDPVDQVPGLGVLRDRQSAARSGSPLGERPW